MSLSWLLSLIPRLSSSEFMGFTVIRNWCFGNKTVLRTKCVNIWLPRNGIKTLLLLWKKYLTNWWQDFYVYVLEQNLAKLSLYIWPAQFQPEIMGWTVCYVPTVPLFIDTELIPRCLLVYSRQRLYMFLFSSTFALNYKHLTLLFSLFI